MLLMFTVIAALAGSALAETGTAPRVVATYFHRTLRCQTCLHIESLARYDVTDVMASDMASGQLEWRLVNFEEEENARFEEEFGLDGPSLVITIEDGDEVLKWIRMDRVWEIYDDVEAFDAYVLDTLEEYLMAASEIVAEGHSSH
jgi:hypothetical protein